MVGLKGNAMIDDSPISSQSASAGHKRSGTTGAREPIDVKTLFDGQTEIQLDHGGEIYRLRITSTGKLILNK